MNIPQELYYSREHEWVRVEGEQAFIGITDFAQEHLGDIVFVELPELEAEFAAMDEIGVIESVKAVSPMNTPVAGVIIQVNEELESAPELLNEDCYAHFICVLRMSDAADLDDLMKAEAYAAFCEEEEAK
ncbi:MAG: glycine cleavage system protein GcvH [Syntrophomonadaceae bacterium]|nr:glycine cleavage system protein GcvH [Syntrophomonadaceae bacterium]